MTSFRSIFFVAVLAGLAAGIVLAGLQGWITLPLIQQAEGFEAEAASFALGDGAFAHGHGHGDGGHDAAAWAPADGVERFAYALLANFVGAVGFALLLVAASEFAGGIGTWRQGLLWGAAGFTVFTLAPSLGLPPELPGMPSAELAPRQVWWLGCAGATAAGLALIAFGRSAALALAGVALLILPHAVGAPRPDMAVSPVPAELHSRFVLAVAATSLIFWLALGTAVALIRPHFAARPAAPRRRLA